MNLGGSIGETLGSAALPTRDEAVTWFDAVVARVTAPRVLEGLRRWETGRLTLHLPDGSAHQFGPPGADRSATLRVHSPAFLRKFLLGGDLGAGESYMDGEWSADDRPGSSSSPFSISRRWPSSLR
jgi:hypothetical protein